MEDSIPYEEIVADLNLVTKSRYSHKTPDTRKKIRARWNERIAAGRTPEEALQDFKRVHRIKFEDWVGTEWEIYLRPFTLYSGKFEGYLNQKPRNRAPQQMVDNAKTLLNWQGKNDRVRQEQIRPGNATPGRSLPKTTDRSGD